MGRPKNRLPNIVHHKPTGQARIRVNGRDVYLGKFGSKEAKAEHDRICAEIEAAGGPEAASLAGKSLTISELVDTFWDHVVKHYRHPDGRPTSEVRNLKDAIRPVLDLYGETPAAEFGPLALKAVREVMVKKKLCRTSVNARVNRVRRMFKWAAGEQLIPVSIHQALSAVAPLKRGRTDAPERDPVKPVADDVIEKTVAAMLPLAASMIRVMRLTGMRPGQARSMKVGEIDRATWVYSPGLHKTAYLGKALPIQIGPKARAILEPLLAGLGPDDVVFSPARLKAERYAALRAKRVSKVPPSQKDRAKPKSQLKRTVPHAFTKAGLMMLVRDACDRAFPPPLAPEEGESRAKWLARLTAEQRANLKAWRKEHRWHPNQLRHTFASEVRRLYGLEAAQVLLGHSRADVTQVYAERNQSLASKVAAEIG